MLFISGKIQAQNGHKPCGENCEISCPGGTARAIDRYCPVCGEKQKKEREQKKKDEADAVVKKNLELENQKLLKNAAHQKQKLAAKKIIESRQNEMVIAKPTRAPIKIEKNIVIKKVKKKESKSINIESHWVMNYDKETNLWGFVEYNEDSSVQQSWEIAPKFENYGREIYDLSKEYDRIMYRYSSGADCVNCFEFSKEIFFPGSNYCIVNKHLTEKDRSECDNSFFLNNQESIIDREGNEILKGSGGDYFTLMHKVPFVIRNRKGCSVQMINLLDGKIVVEFNKSVKKGTGVRFNKNEDFLIFYSDKKIEHSILYGKHKVIFVENLKREFGTGKYQVFLLFNKNEDDYKFLGTNVTGYLMGRDGSFKIVNEEWIKL